MEEIEGYYFITTLDSKKDDSRCVGYVRTFEEANLIVTENMYDLNETCYDYAVIEHIPFGIYHYDTEPKWYRYDEVLEKYVSIECPNKYKNQVGFSIG